ncbi:hypothetical protein ACFL3I_08730 [Pseudomonadota bacterium]
MLGDKQPQADQPGPELRPPADHPGPAAGKTGSHGLLVWGALGVVVVLVLAVLLVLPKMVSETADKKSSGLSQQVSKHPAESTPVAGQESVSSRAEAEQALQDFLHTRARLEHANAPVWGEPEWSKAVDGAAEANDLFAQRKFSMANEVFAQSLALLQLLESETGERLAQTLDAGWQALQADDSESAITYFETAKPIMKVRLKACKGHASDRTCSG